MSGDLKYSLKWKHNSSNLSALNILVADLNLYFSCAKVLDTNPLAFSFMVEKAAQEPASFKMSRSRPAELWVNFPHGWDTLPDGELDASALRRLTKF